jgi:hypothetical protein
VGLWESVGGVLFLVGVCGLGFGGGWGVVSVVMGWGVLLVCLYLFCCVGFGGGVVLGGLCLFCLIFLGGKR